MTVTEKNLGEFPVLSITLVRYIAANNADRSQRFHANV